MQIIEEPSEVADGARMAINAGPVWTEWTAEHRNCIPGESFIDVQVEGPFTSWKHKHEFHAIKSASSMIYTFNRRWGSSETISGEK